MIFPLLGLMAGAADLTWDSSTTTTGAQNGTGNWTTGGNNWWTGTANQPWANNDNATFGSGTGGAGGTITVPTTVTANNIVFAAPQSGNFTVTGGAIVLNGTLTNTANTTVTLNSALTGPGSITRSLAGTLNLGGDNSGLTGAIAAEAGTIDMRHLNALGTSGTGTTVASGGQVTFGSLATGSTVAEPFSIAGLSNAGALRVGGSKTVNLSGLVTLTADATVKADGNAVFNFNGGVASTGNYSLTFGTDGSGSASSIGGSLNLGTGRLIKTSSARVNLNATPPNTLGGVTINGGTLGNITSDDELGADPGSPVADYIILASGTADGLAVTGSFTLAANKGITLGPAATAGSGTLAVNSGATLTYDGAIVNNGPDADTLRKVFAGTLALGGTSTYSGGTVFIGGVVAVATMADVGTPSPLGTGNFSFNGGTLRYTGPTKTINRTSTITANASGGIDISDPATVLELTGAIGQTAASGRLTKSGAGTLVLAATNTYTGSTTVNGGKLSVAQDANLGTAPGTPTTGAMVLNNGALLASNTFNLSSNRGIALGAAAAAGTGTIEAGSGQTLTYDGIITNNGIGADNLVKQGDGTLQLGGASTFTGTATVATGTLALSTTGSLAASVIDVGTAGTLDVSAVAGWTVGATQTLAGDGTVTGSGTVAGTLAPGGTTGLGSLAVSGNLALPGTMAVELRAAGVDSVAVGGQFTGTGGTMNFSIVDPPAPGIYPLVSYGTLVGAPAVNLGYLPASRMAASVDPGTGTADAIKLTIGASPTDLVWSGLGGDEWKLSSTQQNFKNGAVDDIFYQLDRVVFNDSATGYTVSLTGELAPASLVFDHATPYTLTGTGGLVGNTGLTKKNSGTLILATNNSNTGPTVIEAGTLQLGDGGTTGSLGAAAITNDGVLRVKRSDALTLSQTISGTGSFAQAGTGTTTLAGLNTYAGPTVVSAGTLSVAADTNLGTPPAAATPGHLVLADATLAATAGFTLHANRSVVLGPLDAAGTGTVDVQAGTLVVEGLVTDHGPSGLGSLVKAGAGSLSLQGINTYTGTTTLNAGTTFVYTIDSLGATGAGQGTIVADGGRLSLQWLPTGSILAEPLNLAGTGGTGALHLGGGKAVTVFGPVTLSGATNIKVDGSASLAFTNPAGITGTGMNLSFTLDGAAEVTRVEGPISLGTGSLSKGSGAVLEIRGANTYGATVINSGTLRLGESSNNTAAALGSGEVTNNGILAVRRGSFTLSNTIGGTGAVSFDPAGGPAATYTVTGTNSYAGTTAVAAGATLLLNGSHTGGGAYTVAASATLGGTGPTTSAVSVSGSLAPGAGLGTLATGPLTLAAGATLAIEINTSSAAADRLDVTGDVITGGALVNLVLTDLGANVALPAGTKLTLIDYSGVWADTDIVHFGGNPVPNGSTITFGANSFTVDYSDDSLGGTAMTLTAVATTTPFQSWVSNPSFGLAPADQDPGDDPDGDGNNNLMEFALDGHPNDRTNSGKIAFDTVDSNDPGTDRDLHVTLAVRNGATLGTGPGGSATLTVDGIVYTIQASATLAAFDKAVSEVVPASPLSPAPNTGWTARTFQVSDSNGLPDKRFIRVGVAKQ